MLSLYKKISISIVDSFIKEGVVKNEEREVYTYGFEIMISHIIYTALFILISALTNTILPSVGCFIGFFIVRSVAGGYHAKTYLKCHLLTCFSQVLFIVLYKNMVMNISTIYYLSSVFILFSVVSILICAPIDNYNKQFIKNEKEKFRRFSVVYSCILSAIAVICLFITNPTLGCALLSFSIGTLFATLSLIGAKLINKKGDRSDEEN